MGTDFSGFRGEIVADHNHSFTPAAEQRREAEMSLKRSVKRSGAERQAKRNRGVSKRSAVKRSEAKHGSGATI